MDSIVLLLLLLLRLRLRKLLVVVAVVLLEGSSALVVEVPSGRAKCLTEELRRGALSVARYRVPENAPANLTISARVSDPDGETLHQAESVARGEFSFEAATGGKHTACFWSPRFELSASVAVDVEWTAGIRARDWPSLAKKGDLHAMEAELRKLEDSVKLIHQELMFLREREIESQRMNEGTTARMLSFSMLSIVVCLGVAGLQLWHLKTFFERKKIL